jgi:hypothetical protein
VRRLCALALFVAAVPLAAAFVPGLRSDAAACAMACHAGSNPAGMSCCLAGGSPEHPLLRACGSSADGMPPAPGCSLVPPPTGAQLPSLFRLAALAPPGNARTLSHPSDPPEPVPLPLS